jgi:hypothetical protein
VWKRLRWGGWASIDIRRLPCIFLYVNRRIGILINFHPVRQLKKLYLVALFLTGCASTTGVVSVGKDAYMIAREDNGPAASLGAIKASTFKEASAFCSGKGKTMQVTQESDTPRSFGQFPQTTLQFSCV